MDLESGPISPAQNDETNMYHSSVAHYGGRSGRYRPNINIDLEIKDINCVVIIQIL